MPIFIVEKEIFNSFQECIICPIKGKQMFLNDGIYKEIFDKVDKNLLTNIFYQNNTMIHSSPIISKGLSLSKIIIHIIVSDMTLCKSTFKDDMYKAYNEIFKIIIKRKINSVVFLPLEYGNKRFGAKNSLRTCIFFLNYFMKEYNVNCNFYIVTDSRTVADNIFDYDSTYVSKSYPLSKRHKPANYPFKTKQLFDEFVVSTKRNNSNPLVLKENYNLDLNNKCFLSIYTLIKKEYDSDVKFCIEANISKDEYTKIIESENYVPRRNILISILLALHLDINAINSYLKRFYNVKLDSSDHGDKIIITHILVHDYDVININQELFLAKLPQIGSYDFSYSNLSNQK